MLMKEQGKRQEAKEMLKERKAMSKDTEAMMPMFPGGIFGYVIVGGILFLLVIALWLTGLLLAGIGAAMLGVGGYVLLGFSPIGLGWPSTILGTILAIIGIVFLGVF
jgi:hypothetical protein